MIPKEIIYAACIMLLVALLPMPYSYYTLLRVCAFCLFGFLAYSAHVKGAKLLPWVFGFMALVFNPLFKIHFSRELWGLIDIASAIVLLVTIKDTCQKETPPK